MQETKESLFEKLEQLIEEQGKKSSSNPQENRLQKKSSRASSRYIKWIRSTPVIISAVAVTSLFYFNYLHKETRKLRSQHRSIKKNLSHLKKNSTVTMPMLGGTILPVELRNIPLGETSGLVLGTKRIQIRNVDTPYNAAIIEREAGYLLFFRQDQVIRDISPNFDSFIGVVKLDKNFEQTDEEFTKIDLQHNSTEDPRILELGDEFFICYNANQTHNPSCRSMRLANINMNDFSVNYKTELDLHMQHIEKNWAPFEYTEENGQKKLYFEYYISPHKIIEMKNTRMNEFTHLIFPDHPPPFRLPWPEMWGHPRGGTAPRKIGDEYLGFFHSSFRDKEGIMWYLMAAYTFEAKPPFRITGISHYPILFDGIYNTPPMNTSNPKLRCIFPAGIAFENRNGKQLVHVSCGENDCAVKIVTLDKEKLLKSLKKF